MEKYVITGGQRLAGRVNIGGAKNAAVAILPAVILAGGVCTFENVPMIKDVTNILKILDYMGADIKPLSKTKIKIDPKNIKNIPVPYEMARLLRASYYFLGALLSKFGSAEVSLPGGCDLGDRPIDQHLKCFKALGADYVIQHGMVNVTTANSQNCLLGSQVYFDKVTVGATINAMLAAVNAKGTTILENVAKEPHIVDLANFLNSIGGDVRGAGTDVIKVIGKTEFKGVDYTIIPDQIEAGTYMAIAAATKGDVEICGVIPKHLEPISSKLRRIGVTVEEFDDSVRVVAEEPTCRYERINIKTMPHPGFPTDMQPQFASLLTLANGTSIITEDIFSNRFRYAEELRRMGADISVSERTGVVQGVDKLTGAPVKAVDLRGGAALVIAALCAEGETEIEGIEHIERGYEEIDEKLRALGAVIERRVFPDKEEVAEKNIKVG